MYTRIDIMEKIDKIKTIQTYNIDAKNKILGRFAVEVCHLLRGKNNPDYAPHKDPNVVVIVKNIKEIKVTGKKYDNKIYYRHSGYIGNLKKIPYKKMFEKDPRKVLRLAVLGMLPKNRLRAKLIKRLKFI